MVVKAARELIQMNRNFLGVADPAGFGSGDSDSDSGETSGRDEQQAINYVIRGIQKMKEMKKAADDDDDQNEAEDGQVGPLDDVIGCSPDSSSEPLPMGPSCLETIAACCSEL